MSLCNRCRLQFGYAHFCATVSKRALPSCRRASDWVKVRSCSGQNRFSLTLSIRLAMNDSHCPSGLFRMATERLQRRICCMPSEYESEWVCAERGVANTDSAHWAIVQLWWAGQKISFVQFKSHVHPTCTFQSLLRDSTWICDWLILG